MATPVGWTYGPWRTQQTTATPYATVPAAAQVLPGVTSGQLERVYEDVGSGGTGITGTTGYGPLSGPEVASLWGGNIGRTAMGYGVDPSVAATAGAIGNKALGIGLNAALGAKTTLEGLLGPMSFVGMAPKAAVTLASLLSKALGGVRGVDPWSGLTPNDIQSARDREGAFAAEAMEAAERAATAQYGLSFDIAGSRGYGPQGYAETPSPPSVTNPDIDTTEPGWGPNARDMGGGDGPGRGGDPGGQSSGPGGAEGTAGGESPWAKGGVSRVRTPTRAVYGEGGEPETAVFVPESFKRPGQQPREAGVEQAMKALLRALRG